ncbi:MAG: hypothetical protein E7020_06800 [Alphaproteobacteria bacterium]|nr:hypothetical protein [Alphaproteobacteria bacterium]
MGKDFFEISSATVKAKILNVHCNGTHPFLLCLVKEFSYKHSSNGKKGKVIFDDYSCKMAFYVKNDPDLSVSRCDAEPKVRTLVNGDIVEFTIHRRDPYHCIFTSFTIVETSQICLAGFSDLQQLANKLGKDDE